jgi:hypothetical protein
MMYVACGSYWKLCRSALRFQCERIVDKVLREAEGDDVVRHGNRRGVRSVNTPEGYTPAERLKENT